MRSAWLSACYRDGHQLYSRALSESKTLPIVQWANHYDLYDEPAAISAALAQLIPFYRTHL
jgi:hypothetical protein